MAGCYVPCDPAYPDDRLQVYMEDGGAEIMVTSAALTERVQYLAPDSSNLQVGASCLLAVVASKVLAERCASHTPAL